GAVYASGVHGRPPAGPPGPVQLAVRGKGMISAPELSAVEQAELVRSGELSSQELVQASLKRIERLKPTVNAFVAVCAERALAEASAIAPGDPRPLCGVPIGVKDLLSPTEGIPTTHGSAGFGDWVADHDTAHIRR